MPARRSRTSCLTKDWPLNSHAWTAASQAVAHAAPPTRNCTKLSETRSRIRHAKKQGVDHNTGGLTRGGRGPCAPMPQSAGYAAKDPTLRILGKPTTSYRRSTRGERGRYYQRTAAVTSPEATAPATRRHPAHAKQPTNSPNRHAAALGRCGRRAHCYPPCKLRATNG